MRPTVNWTNAPVYEIGREGEEYIYIVTEHF